MRMHIAVCDDSETEADYIRSLAEDWAKDRKIDAVVEPFFSAEQFLFRYEEDHTWDLLLLDIEMKEMDGVTLARRLRRDSKTMQFLFITGYEDYIAEGYEVAALHYLMKPVRREKLFAVLDRAAEKQRENAVCLNLELPGELVRIPLHEIRYLDVCRNYVTVHCEEDYTVKRTLGEFEQELGSGFFRIGRGCLVNLRYVQRTARTQVLLADGTVLPLPRGMYEKLNRAIIEQP